MYFIFPFHNHDIAYGIQFCGERLIQPEFDLESALTFLISIKSKLDILVLKNTKQDYSLQ